MAHEVTSWQPFKEPPLVTLARNGAIALAGGAALALWRGGLAVWPIAVLLMLWPTFGGHAIEVFFLNFLRPRLPAACVAQVAARLGVWFVGGILLGLGMRLTAMLTDLRLPRLPPWWLCGLGFMAVEFVAHLAMAWRHRPNFYDGRG